jgi:hypothetical protein
MYNRDIVKKLEQDLEEEARGSNRFQAICLYCGQSKHKPLICRSELSLSQGTGRLGGFDLDQ